MKLSKYTIFVSDYPESGQHLVFNTLTGTLVVIDKELREIISSPHAKPSSGDRLEGELLRLEELGIMVGDEVDEDLILEHWINRWKYDNSTMDAGILPTYACNFRCVYCVEKAVEATVSMNETMSRTVVNWLMRRVEKLHPHDLFISYYGGEPLLNVPAIELISETLFDFAQKGGIEYEFQIETNGSLLTRNVVGRLLKYGLKRAIVTIDGERTAHDMRRPFKSGAGSFDVIMDNISAVADMIEIDIRGNFDSENFEHMLGLLDQLEQRGLKGKVKGVEFVPIMKTSAGLKSPVIDGGGWASFSEPGLPENIVYLKRETLRRGFLTNTGIGHALSSPIIRDNYVIIDPKGKIYKLLPFVGYEDFIVGDIFTDEFNYRHVEFMTMDVWRRCLECPYVPVCGGGSRYGAYVKYGDFRRVLCEKEYFEKAGSELLKMEYELSISQGPRSQPHQMPSSV
ncbi:MAG TPA: radical SAM protein [Candidatus Latescibacteria bacterium]|nr:radical SAM protein [Candidatus Latescibacterota bacterium]